MPTRIGLKVRSHAALRPDKVPFGAGIQSRSTADTPRCSWHRGVQVSRSLFMRKVAINTTQTQKQGSTRRHLAGHGWPERKSEPFGETSPAVDFRSIRSSHESTPGTRTGARKAVRGSHGPLQHGPRRYPARTVSPTAASFPPGSAAAMLGSASAPPPGKAALPLHLISDLYERSRQA